MPCQSLNLPYQLIPPNEGCQAGGKTRLTRTEAISELRVICVASELFQKLLVLQHFGKSGIRIDIVLGLARKPAAYSASASASASAFASSSCSSPRLRVSASKA